MIKNMTGKKFLELLQKLTPEELDRKLYFTYLLENNQGRRWVQVSELNGKQTHFGNILEIS